MITQKPRLSVAAAERVAALRARQNRPSARLRLMVTGGGCSGFQYKFGLEDDIAEDDHVVACNGVEMLVDATSLPFLDGAVVDYVETLGAAAFQVTNPNARSSCGCGSSFSV